MKEIESLFETYKNAVFQKDVEAFLSIFDEHVRIFDMWEWTYEGLVSWREMVKGWFGSLGTERVVVTFDEVQVEAAGGMAVASAYVRFAAISEQGEELRYLQNRLTWVAQQKGGVWKIIHEHTSGPVDGETMKVIMKR
ncbi:nuclear transport factor 2 family protein [Flavitalea sp. BT771]|uniref:YybH family protein n=1 Tax=Flavitalea sp. BT771 TaxID=3063329 RepID=UPI0026E264AF|nr:nuclear transport factor 2 family protein [Flavitalea sp. BT771]MDO6434465.1 nuclear transport factor 2 family protein [Flavitalea sp. BT771]MDV6223365.1 nuclear transport factor 2 family protein [Flavitalea sp. BT771]